MLWKPLALSRLALGCVAAVTFCHGQGTFHALGAEYGQGSVQIVPGIKEYRDPNTGRLHQEAIFRDKLGREVCLRGYNVSGSAKNMEWGFKPFINQKDASKAFQLLREETGANCARLVMAWEGVNPKVDTIDYQYLDEIVGFVKEAAKRNIYLFLDFHQDNYSRWSFTDGFPTTGNGAPKYIIEGNEYPKHNAPTVAWPQHQLSDEKIRRASRNFWNNVPCETSAGTRNVRDVFVWQVGQTLRHVKAHLSAAEFDYILGVEPLNEPFDGGMEGLSGEEWTQQKLWPFYEAVRREADAAGWEDKLVYCEPSVFWSTNAGIVKPLGGGFLPNRGPRYGFAPHFYDAGRVGLDWRKVENGAYLPHFDRIRQEARSWMSPTLVTEFGVDVRGSKAHFDPVRVIKGFYQGMEFCDAMHAQTKDRFMDAFAPLLSSTQWHWDIYKDRHHELLNRDPKQVKTQGDGWNDEDYSVIKLDDKDQLTYTLDPLVLWRAYPRRAQGDVMHFYHSDTAKDRTQTPLHWAALRPVVGDSEYLHGVTWSMLVWRGRQGDAPTELYLPKAFDPANTVVITDKRILSGLTAHGTPLQEKDEVLLKQDIPTEGSHACGHQLLIWQDDPSKEAWHYVLVFDKRSAQHQGPWDEVRLAKLQKELNVTVVDRHLSAIYLKSDIQKGSFGSYENPSYPPDAPAKPFKLEGESFLSLGKKKASFWWEGGVGDAWLLLNGKPVEDVWGWKDSRKNWVVEGDTTYQIQEKSGRRSSNPWKP